MSLTLRLSSSIKTIATLPGLKPSSLILRPVGKRTSSAAISIRLTTVRADRAASSRNCEHTRAKDSWRARKGALLLFSPAWLENTSFAFVN